MFCKECGVEIKEGSKFCMNCGVSIETMQESNIDQDFSKEMIGNNAVSTLKVMVGKKEAYYLPIFERIEKGEKAGATGLGLIAPLWMLYRKMYREFFILLVVGLIGIIPFIGQLFAIGVLIYLICNLHQLYYKSILRKLAKNNLTGVDIKTHQDKLELVKHLGGTTYVSIIIYIVSVIIISILVSLLAGLMVSAALATDVHAYTDTSRDIEGEGASVSDASSKEEQEIVDAQKALEEMEQQREVLIGGILTPLEYFENMQENEVMPYTLGEHARDFLINHPELFYNNKEETYETYVDDHLTFKELDKNIDRYGKNLIQVSGTVIDIEETELFPDVYVTALHILDEEYNNYYTFYLGELEDIYSDTEVAVYGLPIGKASFENVSGGYTKAILLAGVDVYQNGYQEAAQANVEQDKVNTQMNYSDDDTFTEDIIGFDVYDYVNTVFTEVSELGSFLYDYNFSIVSGDEGYFEAVDDLGTTLSISTKHVEGGYTVDFFEAEIPNYIISLKEVEAICNPNGDKALVYDEERVNYYYSTIRDYVEVRYNFTFDSLRMENPDANSITVTVVR